MTVGSSEGEGALAPAGHRGAGECVVRVPGLVRLYVLYIPHTAVLHNTVETTKML